MKEQALETRKGNKPEVASAFFEEARKYYECILLVEPNNKGVLRERGRLSYEASQFDCALQYWAKLLKLSKTSCHYYLCALANERMGKEDKKECLSLWDWVARMMVGMRN